MLLFYQQKINVTMELNVQIQKELDEKDETIRMLEDKNTVLKRTIDAKVDELETLKQQVSLLEQEVCGGPISKIKLHVSRLFCSCPAEVLRKRNYWRRKKNWW